MNQPLPTDKYTVSGTCNSSRLQELRKYTVTNDVTKQYVTSTSINTNGVHLALCDFNGNSGVVRQVYYIDKIKYIDERPVTSTATTTTFILADLQLSPLNFDNKPLIKTEESYELVENPQISKDVFIVRQQLSVFERIYRIRAVNGLNDVLNYGGGNYFKIYENT
jgi:hypothetical protein